MQDSVEIEMMDLDIIIVQQSTEEIGGRKSRAALL